MNTGINIQHFKGCVRQIKKGNLHKDKLKRITNDNQSKRKANRQMQTEKEGKTLTFSLGLNK
jgi:hypothetical protein